MPKFKLYDKVVVVDNLCGHGFNMGDILTVIRVSERDYTCEREGDHWVLVDDELKAYEEPKRYSEKDWGDKDLNNAIEEVYDEDEEWKKTYEEFFTPKGIIDVDLCKQCGYLLNDEDGTCLECLLDDEYAQERENKFNPVSKPSHYNQDGIECIDYIRQVLGPEGFVAYCRGNMMKYNHRAEYKGNTVEDMAKAEQYLIWANETLSQMDEAKGFK